MNIKEYLDILKDLWTPTNASKIRMSISNALEMMGNNLKENIDRQDNVENQFQDVLDETTGKDVINGPEIIAARNGETNLKARLDKEKNEVAAQLAQKTRYFEAPKQPSFNALDEGHIWDGTNRTQDDFRKEMIDPLVATAPDYVTKTLLGKDTSGTYDIHEYIFEPEEYEQTILISTGVHGRETVPVYSIYRLMHYLINDPDIHQDIQYLRDHVRICIIPVLNPWGGSNLTTTGFKHYGNVNGSSITRNIPFEWELTGTAGGNVPFEENEAKILYDWVTKYKNIASFYLDFHTDWSGPGQAPAYDNFVYPTVYDDYGEPVIRKTLAYLNNRVRRLYGREPEVKYETGADAKVKHYATNFCNIPSATIEFCETRFGGRFGGSIDITEHLTMAVNYISALTKADLLNARKEKDAELKSMGYVSTELMSFHSMNEDINATDFSDEVHEWYDKFISSPPSDINVTTEVLTKDSTNTYDINQYTFTPHKYEKTIFLYAGMYSRYQFKEVFVLQNLIKYIYTSNDYVAEQLRKYYRIIVIPVVDVKNFNKSISTYDKNGVPDRAIPNADVRRMANDFGTFALKETQAIKKVVENNFVDTSIEIGSHFDFANIYTIDELNNIYQSLYTATKYAEKTFNSRLTAGEYGLISDAANQDNANQLEFMSKHVAEPSIFRMGRRPFDYGIPIYGANITEMRRFTEILINALYGYMTTNFDKSYEIEPINIAPPFYDNKWELHDSTTLLDDYSGIKFSPTGPYLINMVKLDVNYGEKYMIDFKKEPSTNTDIRLQVKGINGSGDQVGTSLVLEYESGLYEFNIVDESIVKVKVIIGNTSSPYGEAAIKNLVINKVLS